MKKKRELLELDKVDQQEENYRTASSWMALVIFVLGLCIFMCASDQAIWQMIIGIVIMFAGGFWYTRPLTIGCVSGKRRGTMKMFLEKMGKWIVKHWNSKELLFGLPGKVFLVWIAVLIVLGILILINLSIMLWLGVATPIIRLENELAGHISILMLLLVLSPVFRSAHTPPMPTRRWFVLVMSLACLLVGVGTRLINAWVDAKVIMPWLAVFFIPGDILFVLWAHGGRKSDLLEENPDQKDSGEEQ